MKSIIIRTLSLVIIIAYSINGKAQVGINSDGSNPDASAMLDVKSTDKGLLVPRMTTAQRTAIVSPATGLLIFDNETESFWFRDASAWVELKSGNISSLSDADGNTKIQVEESANEDIIRFDIGGTEKVIIGDNPNGSTIMSFPNNSDNTFIGTDAGNSNDKGIRNTFQGYQAGNSNIDGHRNTFQGYETGYSNTDGSNNTFQGNRTGYSNTTGSNNVFIGNRAGYSNIIGSGNIFIGDLAGLSEVNSNRLYIENSNSSNPLIYGEFDNDLIRINGELNINNTFSFPTTDGTTGQILQTDGSGQLTWTSSFNETLEIVNNSSTNSSLTLEGTTSQGSKEWEMGITSNHLSQIGVIDLVFNVNNTEKMRLDGDGNLDVADKIEFGSKNQNPVAYDRQVVMVSGKGNESGGFSSSVTSSSYISAVARNSTGTYTITFVSGTFVDEPIITITALKASSGDNRYAVIESISTTKAVIKIRNDSGNLRDAPFNFIAIGEQ